VSDFSPFSVYDETLDLTSNLSQKGGNESNIKTQGYGVEDQDQDSILYLGGPMTREIVRKAHETLQHKVTHLLEAQPLKAPHFEETKLITCITCLEQ